MPRQQRPVGQLLEQRLARHAPRPNLDAGPRFGREFRQLLPQPMPFGAERVASTLEHGCRGLQHGGVELERGSCNQAPD